MSTIDSRLTEIGTCIYRVSIKIVAIRDGKLLVVKEEAGFYSLPGGGWEYDETLGEALSHELREEIDLEVKDVVLSDSPVFIAKGGVHDGMPRIFLLFRADLKESAQPKDTELAIRWVNATDLEILELGPNTLTAKEFLLGLLKAK